MTENLQSDSQDILAKNKSLKIPIVSKLADDPIVKQLLPLFARLLNERVDELRGAAQSSDWEKVARLAHTIKGSAHSYGYDTVADMAAILEHETKTKTPGHQFWSYIDELDNTRERVQLGLTELEHKH